MKLILNSTVRNLDWATSLIIIINLYIFFYCLGILLQLGGNIITTACADISVSQVRIWTFLLRMREGKVKSDSPFSCTFIYIKWRYLDFIWFYMSLMFSANNYTKTIAAGERELCFPGLFQKAGLLHLSQHMNASLLSKSHFQQRGR